MGARTASQVGLMGLCTCLAAMSDPFCVGGGRRLPGSSKSGPGKDGSRHEVRLPVRHDPPKLGKRVRLRSTSSGHRKPVLGASHLLDRQLLGDPLRAFPGWG